MFIRPLFGINLRPKLYTLLQARNVRPIIKINKEKFQISVDVHQFTKDEIRVKVRPEFIVIEGKQERKTKGGSIIRQFVKKFKLPKGCKIKDMKSEYSKDGHLTITAPRQSCDLNLPCETLLKIKATGENKEEEPSCITDLKAQDTKEQK